MTWFEDLETFIDSKMPDFPGIPIFKTADWTDDDKEFLYRAIQFGRAPSAGLGTTKTPVIGSLIFQCAGSRTRSNTMPTLTLRAIQITRAFEYQSGIVNSTQIHFKNSMIEQVTGKERSGLKVEPGRWIACNAQISFRIHHLATGG